MPQFDGVVMKMKKIAKYGVFLLVVLIIAAFLLVNPVKSREQIAEVNLFTEEGTPISLNLSKDQEREILQIASRCFCVRKLISTKSEYSGPGVCHVRTENRSLFFETEAEKTVIHTYRYSGNIFTDGEWMLYPTEAQYESILRILESAVY